jgi:hypothetical protein
MFMSPLRFGPLSDYTANCRPVLLSERSSHRNKTANFRQQHSDRKQYLVASLTRVLDTKTYWLTVNRKATSNLEPCCSLPRRNKAIVRIRWTEKDNPMTSTGIEPVTLPAFSIVPQPTAISPRTCMREDKWINIYTSMYNMYWIGKPG